MSLADTFAADEQAGVFAYWSECLTFMRGLPDNWCHAVVTDPPYGLADHRADVVAAAITAWATGDRERVPDGRGFMGRRWDAFVPPPAVWDECLRVLKPGGHLAVFAGSRTADLMGLSIRLAGFDMRDGISAWLYGSGFPKSLDVGKALSRQADQGFVHEVKRWLIDRFAESGKTKAEINRECGFTASDYLITEYGADAGGRRTSHLLLPYGEKWARLREVVGFPDTYDAEVEKYAQVIGKVPVSKAESAGVFGDYAGEVTRYATTDAARAWSGWGTALKPAHEPILIARKPLAGTVAANTLAHGCGGLNVDACRVGSDDKLVRPSITRTDNEVLGKGLGAGTQDEPGGRWPTNVVLAHAPLLDPVTGEVVGDACADGCVPGCHALALDEQSGHSTSPPVGSVTRTKGRHSGSMAGGLTNAEPMANGYGDSGGASRFYPTFRYTAKAGKRERPQAWGRPTKCTCPISRPLDPETGALPPWHRRGTVCATCERPSEYRGHPTVKPQGLLEWLVRLLVPGEDELGAGQAGTVLDPFAGSGSLGEAARTVGARAVLVEQDVHSARLVAARLGVPEPARDPSVPSLPVRERASVVELVATPEPTPTELLLADANAAGSKADLMTLYRRAVADGLWTDDVRATFTARRLEIEGVAA